MRELAQKHEIQEIEAQAWSPHPKGVNLEWFNQLFVPSFLCKPRTIRKGKKLTIASYRTQSQLSIT